ncbi:MAG: Smr/MutS family protein [Gammaproteobacteria bacterium]
MAPKLDDKDRKLFREAVGDVAPLQHDRHVPVPRRRPPRARFSRAHPFAVLDESLQGDFGGPLIASEDALSYRRPGVPDTVLRKLRRGDFRVAGEIDLHGLTVVEANRALRAFLGAALARSAGCVRIIHGKGLRSGERGAVLKSAVSNLLRRTSAVMAFVSARPADGGTGAVYVLLSHS